MHPLGFRQKPRGNPRKPPETPRKPLRKPRKRTACVKKRLRQGFLHREQLRSSESFAKTAPWQLRSFCAESRYAAQKVLRRVCTLATQKFLHRSNSKAQRVLRRWCLGSSEVSAQRAATQLSRSCEESAEGAESHCAAQHVGAGGTQLRNSCTGSNSTAQRVLRRRHLVSSEVPSQRVPCQVRSFCAESSVQSLQRAQRATPQLSRFCAEGTIATQKCLRRSFYAEATLPAQKFLCREHHVRSESSAQRVTCQVRSFRTDNILSAQKFARTILSLP